MQISSPGYAEVNEELQLPSLRSHALSLGASSSVNLYRQTSARDSFLDSVAKCLAIRSTNNEPCGARFRIRRSARADRGT